MIEVVYLIFFVLVSYGIGKKILNLFKPNLSLLEKFLFSTAIGYGIFSLLTLSVGVMGFLYFWLFYTILFVSLIIGFTEIKNLLASFWTGIRKIKPKFNLKWVLISIISVIIILYMLAAIAPPFNWDATSYHLAIPKLAIKAHKISYVPHMAYSEFPMSIEMLFLLSMLLKNAILAKLIVFSLTTFLAIAIYSFAKKHLNELAGLLGAAIFLTLPEIAQFSTEALVEIPSSFFIFMAIYAFFEWFTGENSKFLIISASMAGIAASTKPTAPIFAIILSIFVVYGALIKTKSLKACLKTFLIFSLISLAIVSPWYIKSYAHTGNPFYPIFYNIFGGPNWNDKLSQYKITDMKNIGRWGRDHVDILNNDYKGFGLEGNMLYYFVMLPWDLTMHGGFSDTIAFSPVYLAFFPIYFMFKKKSKLINMLLLYSFLFMIFWFITAQSLRYFSPIVPVLIIPCAVVIARLLSYKFFYKKILFILAIGLVFNLSIWYGVNAKQLPYSVGLETEEQFYSKLVDQNLFAAYKIFQYTNNNLPNDSKIFLVGIMRAYFSDLDYVWGAPTEQAYIDYDNFENEEDMYKKLKNIGITHIIYYEYQYDQLEVIAVVDYTPRIIDMINKLIKKHATFIYETHKARLYKLD